MSKKMRRVLKLVSSGRIWEFVNWGFDSLKFSKKITFMGEQQVARPCSKVARPCLSPKILDCALLQTGTAMLESGTAVPNSNVFFFAKLRYMGVPQSVPHIHSHKTH